MFAYKRSKFQCMSSPNQIVLQASYSPLPTLLLTSLCTYVCCALPLQPVTTIHLLTHALSSAYQLVHIQLQLFKIWDTTSLKSGIC